MQQNVCAGIMSASVCHLSPAHAACGLPCMPSVVQQPAGTAGGEAQQADITQLLKELELKKAKLNELRGESRRAETDIAKIRDDDTDAQRLTPDGCVVENNYIQVTAVSTA